MVGWSLGGGRCRPSNLFHSAKVPLSMGVGYALLGLLGLITGKAGLEWRYYAPAYMVCREIRVNLANQHGTLLFVSVTMLIGGAESMCPPTQG